VSIKIGSRIFAPRLFTTLLTLALTALLLALGRWQLHRADEKRVLFEAFAAGTDSTLPIDASTLRLPRYQHLEAAGHYDQARQILIDNMIASGRPGYFVITPFALAGGGWVLVNRGWVPLGASRAERPSVAVGGNERRVRGRANQLPRPGIRLGLPEVLAPPYPVVADYPTLAQIKRLLHESAWAGAAEMVMLDAGEADGYVRDWAAPGFPPMRHIAYAVQWFGLALTLLVIYVVTNLRRDPPSRAGKL
jgi:surfeit locus 1 family protein